MTFVRIWVAGIHDLCDSKSLKMGEEVKTNRGYIATVIGCHCPRCREGKLFQHPTTVNLRKNLLMHKECPVCGQRTEIEVGFYYGTSYVSYAITVALSVFTLVIWWLTIGLSVDDNRFILWLICNAVFLVILQPWLMRFSRSLWISWFVKFDPDWQINKPLDVSERINEDQANNW